jgi:inward rectifier potassium channel
MFKILNLRKDVLLNTKINKESPLFGLSLEDLKSKNAELIILIETFDETYRQMVLHKHSYAQHQWKENVKFAANFSTNEEGQIELHVNKIDKLIEL